MNYIITKKYIKLIIVVFTVFMIVFLLIFINKSNRLSLQVATSGDKKYINVISSVDGELGTFFGGSPYLKLSKNEHIITVKSRGFATELFKIDVSQKGKKSIVIDFIENDEALKIIPALSGEYKLARPIQCTFFAYKTWALCGLSYGQVVLKKDSSNWNVIAIDEYITGETLLNKGAPEELLMFSEDD